MLTGSRDVVHGQTVAGRVIDRLGTRKASFAPADSTQALTGMEIGGVTVFGLPFRLDEDARKQSGV